jgi:hypothetical protein
MHLNLTHSPHDHGIFTWHEISQHLHSRLLWKGVIITALIAGALALLLLFSMNIQQRSTNEFPYGFPYSPHRY